MSERKYDVLDVEESAIVEDVESGEYLVEENLSVRIEALQAAAMKTRLITVRVQQPTQLH